MNQSEMHHCIRKLLSCLLLIIHMRIKTQDLSVTFLLAIYSMSAAGKRR